MRVREWFAQLNERLMNWQRWVSEASFRELQNERDRIIAQRSDVLDLASKMTDLIEWNLAAQKRLTKERDAAQPSGGNFDIGPRHD